MLIPGGCPHQVRNLRACIKVALDLVSPEAAALAGAIRAYIEEGRPVEGAFSRNRSCTCRRS